jgi:hypothetical protein
MMKSIFYPVLALVALTLLVQLTIATRRFRAGFRRQIRVDDFKYGESAAVPPEVCIPNRNYMNLLEAPVLFYVACIVLYVTAGVSDVAVGLAWLYVALRIAHSAIHLTYNKVMHRMSAFGASNITLAALWVLAGLHLAQ